LKFSFSLLFSYFLGAISFGWILSRLVKGVDIRKIEGLNTGTTNTMRASGYPIAILTLLLDGFKGVASDWLARYLASGRIGLEIIAPIFSIIRHNDSFFLVGKKHYGQIDLQGKSWEGNGSWGHGCSYAIRLPNDQRNRSDHVFCGRVCIQRFEFFVVLMCLRVAQTHKNNKNYFFIRMVGLYFELLVWFACYA